ncbi:hypothetical protein MNBD_GAMMA01-1732 [hydrothermal vent metagenome]|uniref:Uncharacterized protein n=1 Tax=hydrothermal vent metagenome TaxID=652676 RepID=A0A3B0VTN6_9ZZZZ
MKNKILYSLVAIFILIILVNKNYYESPKPKINKEVDLQQNKKIFNSKPIKVQDSINEMPELYDNSKSAISIYSQLVNLAETDDVNAATRLVSINSICRTASLGIEAVNDIILGIGSALLDDQTGRIFFNQSLLFSTITINTIDDIYNEMANSIDFCKNFKGEEYDRIFKYLLIAAYQGSNDAKITLWQMEHPLYMQQRVDYLLDNGRLEYLKFHKDELLWRETRNRFLYEAAQSGDSRAWVLLGDALSSNSQMPPNLNEAYKYYYAASLKYDFLFIDEKLELLEKYIHEKDIAQLKNLGMALYENN